jgi:mRNA-degrading endonuclease toxin of MazEF toxin-antitoxin module
MPVRRGDVVLVPVPDTSGLPGKSRPALVVSSDHNNNRLQDAIVAIITTTTVRARLEPTQLFLRIGTPEGTQSGLLHDSAVKCERLHAILQSLIHRTIGSLPAGTLLHVNDCLKAALDLP